MRGKILDNTSDKKQSYPMLRKGICTGTIYLFKDKKANGIVVVPSRITTLKIGCISNVRASNCRFFAGEIALKN